MFWISKLSSFKEMNYKIHHKAEMISVGFACVCVKPMKLTQLRDKKKQMQEGISVSCVLLSVFANKVISILENKLVSYKY